MECILCGEVIKGYGNNPWPVKNEGCCCDICNINYVVPSRKSLYEISKLRSELKINTNN